MWIEDLADAGENHNAALNGADAMITREWDAVLADHQFIQR